MLSFVAHVPHTPLLIPTVGRDNLDKLKKTQNALKILAGELYATQPEVLVILAEHGNPTPESFSVNLNSHYQTDLKEFGDLATQLEFSPEIHLADQIQRGLRKANLPFSLFSDPSLGHAVAVPLICLLSNIKKITILPFFTARNLPAKTHFELGRQLKEIFSASNKRIAVISAGDLSHALSAEAPAGLRPEGKKFDHAVREALKTITPTKLLQLEKSFINEAAECAYLPIITLLGLL